MSHQIHLVPEDISFYIEVFLINMNRLDFSYEQFMRTRKAAFHHAALNAYRAVGKDWGVHILSVFPFQVKCRKLILISSGLVAEIIILFLVALLRKVEYKPSALFHHMV